MKAEILENDTILFFPESLSEETAVRSIQGYKTVDEKTNSVHHMESLVTVRYLGVEDFARDETLERLYGEHGKPVHKEEWEYKSQRFRFDSAQGSVLSEYLNKYSNEGWEVVNLSIGDTDQEYINAFILFRRKKP